mgnify:CR=1 FL=1
MRQRQVDSTQFAFYLTKENGKDGQLTLGGYDSTKFRGAITWLPVIQRNYWMVDLKSISLEGKSITSATRAILDTGRLCWLR